MYVLSLNDSVVAPAEGLQRQLAARQDDSDLLNCLPPLKAYNPVSKEIDFYQLPLESLSKPLLTILLASDPSRGLSLTHARPQ